MTICESGCSASGRNTLVRSYFSSLLPFGKMFLTFDSSGEGMVGFLMAWLSWSLDVEAGGKVSIGSGEGSGTGSDSAFFGVESPIRPAATLGDNASG